MDEARERLWGTTPGPGNGSETKRGLINYKDVAENTRGPSAGLANAATPLR